MSDTKTKDSAPKLGVVAGSPPWSEKRKLEAISFRFYQQQAWGADQGRNAPAVGDYYCITRAGLALYRISEIRSGRVYYRTIYHDDGSRPPQPLHDTCDFASFDYDEFTKGGFAHARCYCPPWCFLENNQGVARAAQKNTNE